MESGEDINSAAIMDNFTEDYSDWPTLEDWPEYKALAETKLGEGNSIRRERLQELRDKLLFVPDVISSLPENTSDQFLLMFLRANHFDVPATVNMIKNFRWMLQTYPQYFQNAFDAEKAVRVEEIFDRHIQVVPSLRDSKGRRLMIYQFANWDPDSGMAFQEIFTNGFMLAMVMAREAKTQVAGVTVVCDAAGFTFKHLRSLAITDMKLLAMVVQEYMPLLYEEVHIVNCPRVAEMGYKLIKPFLGERIREKIKFHTTNALLHSHVDKSVLSNALGGTLDESDYNQVCLLA